MEKKVIKYLHGVVEKTVDAETVRKVVRNCQIKSAHNISFLNYHVVIIILQRLVMMEWSLPGEEVSLDS